MEYMYDVRLLTLDVILPALHGVGNIGREHEVLVEDAALEAAVSHIEFLGEPFDDVLAKLDTLHHILEVTSERAQAGISVIGIFFTLSTHGALAKFIIERWPGGNLETPNALLDAVRGGNVRDEHRLEENLGEMNLIQDARKDGKAKSIVLVFEQNIKGEVDGVLFGDGGVDVTVTQGKRVVLLLEDLIRHTSVAGVMNQSGENEGEADDGVGVGQRSLRVGLEGVNKLVHGEDDMCSMLEVVEWNITIRRGHFGDQVADLRTGEVIELLGGTTRLDTLLEMVLQDAGHTLNDAISVALFGSILAVVKGGSDTDAAELCAWSGRRSPPHSRVGS